MSEHEKKIKQYSEQKVRQGKFNQAVFIFSLFVILCLLVVIELDNKKRRLVNEGKNKGDQFLKKSN